ncbi:MAG: iron-sulfur cluster-binding protein [Desulfovibrionaceae bacterium CG1_02_65_16]|nr:MAG: iron-sulfur cluster-binding protein [Desulfovibrionaceae bacterium CG1_02_65_16]
MEVNTKNFRGLSESACADVKLRAVLDHATRHFQHNRQASMDALPHREEHFARARAARFSALAHLPDLLEELERNATAAGTTVHWAADAEQARSIVVDIAKAANAKVIVKGKSMITEEIGLNPALEAMGAEVWETDLGEFIVQLAGEPPSHIIAPALHKSREDVVKLFAEKLGLHGEAIPELTMLARRALREKFLSADMGITGVNMAVAKTGSVVLVENEGNIRMSTTCPPVHVAVMSIEKVVADFDAVADVLRVLPRSTTGQRMSSYVSVLTGPRLEGETDGARETHLVILDNGRSRVLADPELRETLACVRCGACLNVCPVYQTIGGHAYGWIYPGPIGALLSTLLLPAGQTRDLPYGCTLCGACHRTCPLSINHPKALLALRARAAGGRGTLAGRTHSLLARHPLAYRLAVGAARAVDPQLEKLPRLISLAGGSGVAQFVASRRPPELKKSFSARRRAAQANKERS